MTEEKQLANGMKKSGLKLLVNREITQIRNDKSNIGILRFSRKSLNLLGRHWKQIAFANLKKGKKVGEDTKRS